MAKALQTLTSADPHDPQKWLAGVLRTYFAEVLAKREDALDPTQIEGVHKMRVAIRRLRSLIRDFAEIGDKYPLKTARKDLKRLADVLGAVRDKDVAIEALEKFIPKAKKDSVREGVESMIRRFRESRGRAFKIAEPRLTLEALSALEESFETALTTSLARRSLFNPSNIDAANREIIANRVEDFLGLADALYDPFKIEPLHQLRIAGKHLRYAVELLSADGNNDLKGYAISVAKMQTHLGDVHDCDVWIAQLKQDLRAKKRKALKGQEREAAVWLLSRFTRRRDKAYRSALELWSEWERSGLLDRLKEWEPHPAAVDQEKTSSTQIPK